MAVISLLRDVNVDSVIILLEIYRLFFYLLALFFFHFPGSMDCGLFCCSFSMMLCLRIL